MKHRCSVDGGGKDWDQLLPYVAMDYRMSREKAMGYSPFFLMFGRDPSFSLGNITWRKRSWILLQQPLSCKSY